MALNLIDENKGCTIDRQRFTWKELVQPPISKLDDDAFTRVRIILMNGIEMEALRFSHGCARMNGDLQLLLAQLRRVEQHQASMVNGLIGADHSTLETTIGYEQVAIEVTAAVAQAEGLSSASSAAFRCARRRSFSATLASIRASCSGVAAPWWRAFHSSCGIP